MTRRKIFAALFVTSGCFAHADPTSAQTLGFKVGSTWSTVDAGQDAVSVGRLQAFTGGGFIRFRALGTSIQTELLSITKGYTAEGESGDGDFKLDYLELPVMVRLGLDGTWPVLPYVMAGPSIAYRYGCEVSGESEEGEDVYIDCDDLDLQIADIDIGLRGVAGFNFSAGPGAVLLEAGYTHGLTDIAEAGSAGKIRNRSFGVFAGYSLTIR